MPIRLPAREANPTFEMGPLVGPRNNAAGNSEYEANPSEDRHDVTPARIPRICRPPVPRGSRGTTRCGRTVHLAGLLILPARGCLSDRTVEGAARRPAARLSRDLLGSTRMEGSVLAAIRHRAPESIWPALRRWVLHAADCRRRRRRHGWLASFGGRVRDRTGQTGKRHGGGSERHQERQACFDRGWLRQRQWQGPVDWLRP